MSKTAVFSTATALAVLASCFCLDALAAKALNPEIHILGVEAELYPSMYQALNALAPSAGGTTMSPRPPRPAPVPGTTASSV